MGVLCDILLVAVFILKVYKVFNGRDATGGGWFLSSLVRSDILNDRLAADIRILKATYGTILRPSLAAFGGEHKIYTEI